MGKVMMSGVAPQMTKPIVIKANFADNTWEQIIEACQTNSVPDTWLVGDQKTMTINGTDYAIDIIGKNHDDYADGSGTAPLTFQLHDCYGTTYAMNSSNTNVGGWTACAMRTTHLPAVFELMSSDVQNGIKGVNKLTSEGNDSSKIINTTDKLFLLSEIEVFGTNTQSFSGEGIQYSYYSAGNSVSKTLNGQSQWWWGRSPTPTYSKRFFGVSSSSKYADYNEAELDYGVSFAFCF